MKKSSAFNDAKPRTPRGEARQREIKATRAMEELLNFADEEELRAKLANHYGIVPGNIKYDQILAIWRAHRSGKP